MLFLLLLLILLLLVSSHIQNVHINEIQSWNYLDYFAFKPTPLSVALRHIDDVTSSIIDANDVTKLKEYGIVKYKVKFLTSLYNLRYTIDTILLLSYYYLLPSVTTTICCYSLCCFYYLLL